MNDTWEKAQEWEADWQSTCHNSYGEEEKQIVYAKKMGLKFFHNGKSPYNIDAEGKDILDIGGGPTSLLLKCPNAKSGMVVDPLPYPDWIKDRYRHAGITHAQAKGEDITIVGYDEAWIYNVLQHVVDPGLVIENAKKACDLIRIFEWVGTVKNVGHPHVLEASKLDEWLGGEGKVEYLSEKGCVGKCYYGIFPI